LIVFTSTTFFSFGSFAGKEKKPAKASLGNRFKTKTKEETIKISAQIETLFASKDKKDLEAFFVFFVKIKLNLIFKLLQKMALLSQKTAKLLDFHH
jgi:hypothetical protein